MTTARPMLLLAALAALVVTLGLLAVRSFETGALPWRELAQSIVTYVYVWFCTTAVMVGGAWWSSRRLTVARRVSSTDPLTGLFNRRHFGDSLLAEIALDRHRGLSTCVLCLDLDRFKNINDQYGHGQGDAALVAVAKALTHGLRNRDVVARFGGDEFAILLPGTSAQAAVGIGERILGALNEETSQFLGGLSVSIGVAQLEGEATGSDVLEAADRALYCAKRSGGGRVSLAPRGPTVSGA